MQAFSRTYPLPARTFFRYLVFLNITMPSLSAYSVWSLPQPTKSPGWNCDHSKQFSAATAFCVPEPHLSWLNEQWETSANQNNNKMHRASEGAGGRQNDTATLQLHTPEAVALKAAMLCLAAARKV